MTDILLLLFSVVALVFAFYAIKTAKSAAPYVPIRKKHIARMIRLANPEAGEQWLDLGSGDGRIVFAVGKRGTPSHGIELHPLLHHYANIRRQLFKKSHTSFTKEDLWQADVSHADIVSIFFIKDKMPQLKEKLQREMKPGSRIVSYVFRFPNWHYEKKDGSIYFTE